VWFAIPASPPASEPPRPPALGGEYEPALRTKRRERDPGDYHLTGLITCPACGHKYVGTAATGRNRTYRYYTRFSRSRYSTHGCQATRLPADTLETAVLGALTDFYTSPTLISEAITDAQAHHSDSHAEHTAILTQIKQKQAALDPYFTAFENGTLDDQTAGHRLTKLRGEITSSPPAPTNSPTPSTPNPPGRRRA
jgi:site-specific DNA recombinase